MVYRGPKNRKYRVKYGDILQVNLLKTSSNLKLGLMSTFKQDSDPEYIAEVKLHLFKENQLKSRPQCNWEYLFHFKGCWIQAAHIHPEGAGADW